MINKIVVAAIGVVGAIVIALALFAIVWVNAANYGAAVEAQLSAKLQDNKNVLSNYTSTIREMVQVPDMYRADLERVIRADLESRYGSDGSKATFQWIQERQLPFDSSLYSKIQTAIEAGRRDFANNQRQLLDIKRGYETALNTIPRGWFLSMAGYPKIDLSQYRAIVTEDTARKFDTGIDEPMTLRSPDASK